MTNKMLSKMRKNTGKRDIGEIKQLPVANNWVSVTIFNGENNIAQRKGKVYKETFRGLKKWGYLSISDPAT